MTWLARLRVSSYTVMFLFTGVTCLCYLWNEQGDGSSEEEDVFLDNVPDDDEYDTEDSFIDDAELVRLILSSISRISLRNIFSHI